MVSRITGFGRVAATAAVLGPTFFGNLFQFANLIPFMVFGMLSGSLIPAILVPMLVRRLDMQDRAGAERLASGFLGLLLAIFAAVTALGILITPLLLRIIAPVVEQSADQSGQLHTYWLLMGMMFPQLLFYAVSAVCTAVQQAHGRFALAAGATAVENVGTAAVVGLSAFLFGRGKEIGEVGLAQALVLGLGATGAVAACAALQWWGARRAGVRLVPSSGWRDPEIRALFRTGVASVGYACLSILSLFGMLSIASRVPGGVAAFQIAHAFVHLPVALTASSVAAVQLPELARSFRNRQQVEFVATYRCAVRLVLFVMLPGSLLLVTIGPALARASAFGEMATAYGVSLIAACIAGRGLGAVGEAVLVVATSASYARRDAASPLRANGLLFAVNVVGMGLASMMGGGVALLLTLAIAATASSSLAALYLHHRQLRGGAASGRGWLRAAAGEMVLSLAAMGPAWLIIDRAAGHVSGPWEGIQLAAGAALAAALTYLFIQFVRGSEDMALLLPLLGRLRRGLARRRAGAATVRFMRPGARSDDHRPAACQPGGSSVRS
ncbi:lipid II flippase MurJ [Roseomonas sp. KE2513]|uniref:lipid II flippase MurJ n=1 Tax=Roseomonas sp. KE2513 TaxID=2479202 RepID=UPI0018E02E4E|nr:lipid II flippase MurJ [Roseomonas sp. KE2513]